MGPNSGGGRKNGGAPNVATRARFSTWKPEAKGNGKPSKKKLDMTKLGGSGGSKARVASSISVASTKVKSSSAGLPEWVDINAIESIIVSRELLGRLFKYQNSDGKTNLQPAVVHNDAVNSSVGLSVGTFIRPKIKVTVRSEETTPFYGQRLPEKIVDSSNDHLTIEDDSTVDDNDSDSDSAIKLLEEKLSRLKLAKQAGKSSTASIIKANSISNVQTDELFELISYFENIGFTGDEIISNNNTLKTTFNMKTIDKNSMFLILLSNISHQTINYNGDIQQQQKQQQMKKADENTDLTDECDVLKSIYETGAKTERIFLLGRVCSIVDLSLLESDLNLPGRKEKKSINSEKTVALNIRFIVYGAGNFLYKVFRVIFNILLFDFIYQAL